MSNSQTINTWCVWTSVHVCVCWRGDIGLLERRSGYGVINHSVSIWWLKGMGVEEAVRFYFINFVIFFPQLKKREKKKNPHFEDALLTSFSVTLFLSCIKTICCQFLKHCLMTRLVDNCHLKARHIQFPAELYFSV